MKNSMIDVRNHMMAQLERLGDETNTPEQTAAEIDRAKAIGSLCSVLIESAKVEIQWMRDIPNAVPTGFLPDATNTQKRLT